MKKEERVIVYIVSTVEMRDGGTTAHGETHHVGTDYAEAERIRARLWGPGWRIAAVEEWELNGLKLRDFAALYRGQPRPLTFREWWDRLWR